MALLPLIILALVQGLTEFLPISSSGHLVLVHNFFGTAESWQNHLVLDIAVHIGTLLSVMVYFRKDVLLMLQGLKQWATRDFEGQGAKLNTHVLIASLPVIALGLVLSMVQPSWLLSLNIMALMTIIFGIVLWVADARAEQHKTLQDMTLKEAFLIGLAQAVALIPGTSRSGITMTVARFMGYSRTESAHFSLLLAIIAITGAGLIGGIELLHSKDAQLGYDALLAAAIAFMAGWISIALMMRWLEKCSFKPFAIYRIILGSAILIYLNKDWLQSLLL